MDENPEYASYNGLNRPALVMGIPLMPLLGCAFLMVFGGFAAVMVWGAVGLIVPIVLAIPLLVMKVVCEDDPNALTLLRWRIQGRLLRVKQMATVAVFVTGSEKLRKKNAYRIFKKQKSSSDGK